MTGAKNRTTAASMAKAAPPSPSTKGRVALVVVHGIADQRPGQTVREVAAALSWRGRSAALRARRARVIGCPRAVSRGDWRPLATGGGFSKLAMVLRSTGARLASGGRNNAGQDS